MITAFGPRAHAYAGQLADLALDAIVTELEYLPQAYAAAMERRVIGRPFYGLVLYPDAATHFTMQHGADVFAAAAGYDERWQALDQLASGRMQTPDGSAVAGAWRAAEEAAAEWIGEFFAICDAMLVRSFAEYARLNAFCKRPRPFEPVLAVPEIPLVERRARQRPAVLVWAPGHTSAHTIVHAFALEEFHGDVTCVTSDGVQPPLAARFLTAADPRLADALATATCIVCVDAEDPGAAVAFAARGYGIVAPMSSGAHEFISGVVPCDLRSLDALYTAVTIALGSPAAVRDLPPPPPPAPRLPQLPLAADDLPLVSVIVPTYNRRRDVARVLACLEQQTYPRIEIIVVNDAGEDIRDIVERVPSAKYLVMPQNGGVLRTEEMGIAHARGDYIAALADDDFLNPGHIESLVAAMLISGASIAHGNLVVRHQERVSDGEYVTVGYNARVFNETATPSLALLATAIAGNSILIHRRVFEAIGGYRFDCMLADQEFQMRALQTYTFAYVDRMTAEWRARGTENFSTNADSGPEQRRIYRELHPRPDRPEIERRRAELLVDIGRRPKGQFAFPATVAVRPAP